MSTRKSMATTTKNSGLIPPASTLAEPVGIGLRHPYYDDVLASDQTIGWLEVHPENYFGGGYPRHMLLKAREQYNVSLHAVGLSLGSDQPVNQDHLKSFKEVIDLIDPFLVSDHASWSASGNAHLNDLLPLPYTNETLERLVSNVTQTQDYFGRRILVENPSTYIAFTNNDMSEAEFMNELSKRTGCGILLDINNIYVQSRNHNFDPYAYIDTITPAAVGEMHLAGHTETTIDGHTLLIDTHNAPVRDDVWSLYAYAVKRFGIIPTLIEWDQDFPSFQTLMNEAQKARTVIKTYAPQDNIPEQGLIHAAE